MINRACDCCTQPPGGAPGIEWDSVSASASVSPPACAFASFDGDGRYWLTSTLSASRTGSGSYHCETAPDEEGGWPGSSYTAIYNSSDTWTTKTTCNKETNVSSCEVLASSFSASTHKSLTIGDSDPEVNDTAASGSMGDCVSTDYWVHLSEEQGLDGMGSIHVPGLPEWGTYFGNDFWPSGGTPWTVESATSRRAENVGGGSVSSIEGCDAGGSANASYSKVWVETLTDEWAPEDPLEKAMAALGGFDGDWNDTAGSYKDVTGSAASVRKSRWRIVHPPTGTCFLRVWLRSVFNPKSGGAPVIGSVAPYTWSGSGRPCYASEDKPPTDPANLIKGSAIDLAIPGSEGTVTIEIVKWSYLPSYTPGEGDPNGFPPEES